MVLRVRRPRTRIARNARAVPAQAAAGGDRRGPRPAGILRRDRDRAGPPQRQQSHRTATDQAQRVQIGLPAQETPMEAGAGQAVPPDQRERPDGLPGRHRRADGDRGVDGLVRRPGVAVVDHHDAPAGDPSGEPDGSGQGGAHGLAGRAGQVHPPVACLPRVDRAGRSPPAPWVRESAASPRRGRGPALVPGQLRMRGSGTSRTATTSSTTVAVRAVGCPDMGQPCRGTGTEDADAGPPVESHPAPATVDRRWARRRPGRDWATR